MLGDLRSHTRLTTVGFGMGEYNDDLMERLADQADSNAFHVDGPEQARRAMLSCALGTRSSLLRRELIE